jgi:hypothetical protein
MICGRVMVSVNRQALFLFAIVLTVCISVAAQETPRPLKVRLIVPDPEVCLGVKSLALEAIFSNASDLPVSIYASGIYDYFFIKTVIRGKGSKVESHEDGKDVGTGDPSRHESPVLLQPHASMIFPLQYDISDAFFRESGSYSVRIRYMKLRTVTTQPDAAVGDFQSNEVFFQVNECH